MDTVENALAMVHCLVKHGGLRKTGEVCNAIKEIAACVAELRKGVKPVAACSAAEYKAAIARGNVLCVECGDEVQAVGAHALKAHGMQWHAYIEKWDHWFKSEEIEPQKAGSALSAKRRDTALMIGLGARGQQKAYVKPERGGGQGAAQPKRMTTAEMKSCSMSTLMNYCNAMEGVNDKEWEKAMSIHWERRVAEKKAQGIMTLTPEEQEAEIAGFDRAINLK